MTNAIAVWIAAWWLMFTVPAAANDQIANVAGRMATSLNGHWEMVIDAYDYFSGGKEKSISRNQTQRNKSDRLEYGFTPTQTLLVPGDWNTQQERLFLYEGTVWYKKEFVRQPPAGRRTFVSFGAVNYHAVVYLNGTLLGDHEGGFTPFAFECTKQLKEGRNVLVVRVNNDRKADRVPAMDFDWWNFGGITRDVDLVEVPGTFIRDYSVQSQKGNRGTIEGWVKLDGSPVPASVELHIDELKIHQTIATEGRAVVPFVFKAKPQAWSPEHPRLYDVRLSTTNDRVADRIGFRTVGTAGKSILLNGIPIYLRGISMHEEAMFTGGRITSASQAQALFQYAKEMNCNYVRLAHYPHHEETLRLADEMGLLIWAEIPVWQKINFQSERVVAGARQQLEEMIVRDKNRASIILWSVSNETDEEGNGRNEFLRSLINQARSLDATRLVTMALHKQIVNDTTMLINDPVGEALDVLAVNEYIGWYQGIPEDCRRFGWETVYDKPHLISEFGGEALIGFHADSLTIWSEEFQARLYLRQLDMCDRIPFVSGLSPWILKDFRSPRRLNPEYQQSWNRKGLITNEGQRKPAFFIMKEYYRKKSQVDSHTQR